jgi:hypothetical protein
MISQLVRLKTNHQGKSSDTNIQLNITTIHKYSTLLQVL